MYDRKQIAWQPGDPHWLSLQAKHDLENLSVTHHEVVVNLSFP